MTIYKFLGDLQSCLETSLEVLYNEELDIVDFNDLEVRIWKQDWEDSTLGFSHVGMQMFTDAYTVIVMDKHLSTCVVFHGMKYAYWTTITDDVKERIDEQNMWGASEFNNNIILNSYKEDDND